MFQEHATEIKIPYIESHKDEHGHDHGHDVKYVLDWYAHPNYKFDYGVEDKHTGDYHSQKEETDGEKLIPVGKKMSLMVPI